MKAELVQGTLSVDEIQAHVSEVKKKIEDILLLGQQLKDATQVKEYQAAGLEVQVSSIWETEAANIESMREPADSLLTTLDRVLAGIDIANKQADNNLMNDLLG